MHTVPSPGSTSGSSSSASSTHSGTPALPSLGSCFPQLDSPSSASAGCAGVRENIHPIIVSDLHTFEAVPGGSGSARTSAPAVDFNFDISEAWPLPIQTDFSPDYQTMQEISAYFGLDYFRDGAGQAAGLPVQPQPPQQQPAPQQMQGVQSFPMPSISGQPQVSVGLTPMQMASPVLDATWQSFVEQLGF